MQEKEKSKQKKENAPTNVIISMRYVYRKELVPNSHISNE